MTAQSKIEWTDATWNPVRGCTRVSEGCRNCYAEVMAARFSDPGQWGHGFARRVTLPDGSTDHRWTGRVELIESQLPLPLRWKKPRKIFVNSTSDVFHENLSDADIDRIFAVMALAPQHTFQILTKRPKRMRRYLETVTLERLNFAPTGLPNVPSQPFIWPLPNVWLGTSIEDQDTANDRIPHLLATPAAIRFVSAEPLLGPINLRRLRIAKDHHTIIDALDGYAVLGTARARLHWIIAGGESGPGARPMHPDWVRALRDQCADAGVSFFFKQWGEWIDADQPGVDMLGREDSPPHNWKEAFSVRIGKTKTGRLLDGREHNDMPAVR